VGRNFLYTLLIHQAVIYLDLRTCLFFL